MKRRSLIRFGGTWLTGVITMVQWTNPHFYFFINYQATVEDPKALTRPYTIESKYMLRPGTRLQEYVCENNQDPLHFEQLDKKGLVTR